ncbi:DUF7742 family protein [Pararhodobacter sp.]|uniref:DUF7742 family protein n=1 Tax=Pararhodobacter sp. TaxID=2127056 RepID=UPI002FDCC010
MTEVGLGDVSAAARALMAVPEAQRAALMHRLLDEAGQAARFQRCHGRVHPRLGNGTLMERALAHPLAEVPGPGDPAYLAALAQVIEAVLDWRCGKQAG